MNKLIEIATSTIDRLKKYRSLYEANEMAVRNQIVNPILKALEWDIEDPEIARPNISTEEGIPDYSLIKDGKTILFLEAKKLGIDIQQKEVLRQLARYSFGEGTRYGILTNGAVWILVKSFEEGKQLSERIVWKADFENEPISVACRKINTISRSNIELLEKLVAKIQIVDDVWKSLIIQPDKLAKALAPLLTSSLIQEYPEYHFEEEEIENYLREKTGYHDVFSYRENVDFDDNGADSEINQPREIPKRMKLNSQNFPLNNSYEILINTANWLIKSGKLKSSDCPIPLGTKRYLVNLKPRHRHGDFRAPKKLSNGLYIETHYSTASCIGHARRLLEIFGYKPDILDIET